MTAFAKRGDRQIYNGQVISVGVGTLVAPDGTESYGVEVTGATEHATKLGADAGEELVARAGPEFLAKLA